MGCDIHMKIEVNQNGGWRNAWADLPEGIDDRNYNLFAIFADVRNGTWGPELTPISEPRGLPKDCSLDENDVGDHSFSWVGLDELLEYPWDTDYTYCAYVSDEDAKALAAGEIREPHSYAAYSTHGKQVSWTSNVRSAVRDWPTVFLPELLKLGEPDKVRLVFGFDS